MKEVTTREQIDKLPKWAQQYIGDITSERALAVSKLEQYTDEQKESPFFIEDLVCIDTPPINIKKYVQTNHINIYYQGVQLRVLLRDDHIDISYCAGEYGGACALIPSSFQSFRLSTLERARPKR